MVQKSQEKFWDVNIDNMVILYLIEMRNNSKYLIGYLEKVIRTLVLILPNMSGYVKIKLEIIIIRIINWCLCV